ncbi:hypothetical protein VPH35_043916 [Triticum aestivum]
MHVTTPSKSALQTCSKKKRVRGTGRKEKQPSTSCHDSSNTHHQVGCSWSPYQEQVHTHHPDQPTKHGKRNWYRSEERCTARGLSAQAGVRQLSLPNAGTD